jgi:SAM-dependent methyltransferase
MKDNQIIENNKLDLKRIIEVAKRPEAFASGEALFWDDPHISQMMLEAHLDPEWEAASYAHERIDRTVEWLAGNLGLREGARILDLGCGPGLYCTRFRKRGFKVTGMDYSRNSIRYATKYAEDNNLDIEYIYQNYLTIDFSGVFDAIFLIFYDFGVFGDRDRSLLLDRIYGALKPGGVFAFDVLTAKMETAPPTSWQVCESGFWMPEPHLALEQCFHYPEDSAYLRQHIVIDAMGCMKVYRLWDRYYSVESVTSLLTEHGFKVRDIRGDLAGTPYGDQSASMGIIAEKGK